MVDAPLPDWVLYEIGVGAEHVLRQTGVVNGPEPETGGAGRDRRSEGGTRWDRPPASGHRADRPG